MNPINLITNDDGTYTLEYFGRVVGYIKRSLDFTGSSVFRAVSVQGGLCYASTLEDARSGLLEMSR
jgi:hypothetical protein